MPEGATTTTRTHHDRDKHLFHIIMQLLYLNIFEKLCLDNNNNDISMNGLAPCLLRC